MHPMIGEFIAAARRSGYEPSPRELALCARLLDRGSCRGAPKNALYTAAVLCAEKRDFGAFNFFVAEQERLDASSAPEATIVEFHASQ